MSRRLALVGLLAAIGTASAAGAVQQVPHLRTATTSRGHVSVTFSVGELVPGLIVVGTGVKQGPSGTSLMAHVVLRERVTTQSDPDTGLVAWRTHKALPAGAYRVQVSALITDGVTSCFPRGTDCTQRWSNVGRVTVSTQSGRERSDR
jgi:hypothetical protein